MALSGLSRALRRLEDVQNAAEAARNETLHTWSDNVEHAAKAHAPEDTGRLDRNIEGRVYESERVARVGVWDPATLEYAEHVEKGTSSMREQPFLVPAFRSERLQTPGNYRVSFRRHLGA